MANIGVSRSLFTSVLSINRKVILRAHKSTSSTLEPLNLEEADETDHSAILIGDESDALREEQIQLSRNKSRLLPQHRNMLMGTKPYEEPQSWIHTTLKYNRMQFGRHGLASGVDPRICFETPKELEDRAEFMKVAYPHTVQEMIVISQKERLAKKQIIQDREENITKKLDKLDQWTTELNVKIAKKEMDARAAKERKDRLVEEVRRQFGFKVDTHDERFKELLAQKEKEDKKKQKEAKKKQKDERMLAKLQEIHSADIAATK